MYFNKLLKALWGVLWSTANKKIIICYFLKSEEFDGAFFNLLHKYFCKIIPIFLLPHSDMSFSSQLYEETVIAQRKFFEYVYSRKAVFQNFFCCPSKIYRCFFFSYKKIVSSSLWCWFVLKMRPSRATRGR